MNGVRTEAGRQLERLFRLGSVGGLTDAQLLEQFVAGDGEAAGAAFEAIVERHGPMVLRVCRMVLGDPHAAEDAFQATFLVLARKAWTLGKRELLSNWLYGVATRTARKARIAAARRLVHDREAAVRRSVGMVERPPEDGRDELSRVLHEEIDRLPRSYRAAVVVCYLEGMTQAQAARQLGLSESTVRGRLARARKLLGPRLIRRGVAPATGLLVLGAATGTAVARLPREIVPSTARAALLFMRSGQATPGTVSAAAHGIASGVLATMWIPSLKTITAVFVLVLTIAGAAALAQRAAQAQPRVGSSQPKATTTAAAPTPAPGSETLPAPTPGLSSPLPQDPDTGPRKPVRDGDRTSSPSLSVSSELVKIAPAPIVRAIPVSKDCMILSYIADWAHGHVDNIGVANNNGGVRTLIEWSAIPPALAAAPDRKFLLALYSRDTKSSPPAGPIHAFTIHEDWPELTSWKTQPAYDPEPAATYQFQPGPGWKLFDVTPVVRDQAKAGRKGHGVLLRFLSEDFAGGGRQSDWSGYAWVSREGVDQWTRRRPVLLVLETPKSERTPRPAQAMPPDESSSPGDDTRQPGTKEAIRPKDSHSPLLLDSELVRRGYGPIIRQVLVSKDCMVLSYIPGWDSGNVDNLGIGNNDGGVRTLIDWPEIAPDQASSTDRRFLIAFSARQTISHPPAGPIQVFAILEDWPERTSWATQPRYSSEPAASYEFEDGVGWKLFDITPLVRAQAKAGRGGHGALFRFRSEDFSGGPRETFSDYKIVSREGAGEWANRPLLLVVKASQSEETPKE